MHPFVQIQVLMLRLCYVSKLSVQYHGKCHRTGFSLLQGSRVRPNFSRVRLTKIPGRTGASSHSRKEKKYPRLRNSTKDTPVRLISWSKPIRDSEGRTPPLIGRGPDIPVCVCAR